MDLTVQPDKAKKYDRQLRIWGAHGQEALESARICLLTCSPTGSETLKNLVLGGIASFTIVDDAIVEASDLGNNFFLGKEHVGDSRAQHVSELLQELNTAVTGSYVQETPAELLANQPVFFKDFDLVIATQMEESLLVKLDGVCRDYRVKLLTARSYGLIGYLRASLPEHRVIESKPDNAVEDLRFHRPWPQLQQFADSIDLQTADDITHKHIPYAILLIKAAQQWQQQHSDKLPSTSGQRTEFKNIIKSWQRQIEGIPLEEENFSEALSNASKVWAPPSISSEVRSILEDEATSVFPESDDFWVLAAALKRFVDNEGKGCLPVEGALPDMTATTALYLDLQRIYREQADRDIAAVTAHTHAILSSINRTPKSISTGSIKSYCKHVRNLRGVEGDVPMLKQMATSIVQDCGAGPAAISDDLVGEVCRFGAGELHCIAAVMGGMASQEAIKLLTRQFVPISGAVIYNAMNSTTSVFNF